MDTYTINIQLLNDTSNQLITGNYALYAFKAASGPGQGVPLVWFQTNNFLAQMTLTWTEQYGAYISTQQILPEAVISATNTFSPVLLGDTLTISDAGGDGSISTGGESDGITIDNQSTRLFTTGLSQMNATGSMTPTCAFPLHGTNSDVIVPEEQVLLLFSSQTVQTGAVIEKAFSEGLLFDMTGLQNGSVSVSYDIDGGWDFGTQTICTNVLFEDPLLPLLINPQQSRSTRKGGAARR